MKDMEQRKGGSGGGEMDVREGRTPEGGRERDGGWDKGRKEEKWNRTRNEGMKRGMRKERK